MLLNAWYFFMFVYIHAIRGIGADNDLTVIAVATSATDGFQQFMRSANEFGYHVEVLGMGEQWLGGNVELYEGGGHKLVLLKEHLEKNYAKSPNSIILVTDAYDVIFDNTPHAVLTRFKKTNANVLFSAEKYCWPDSELADVYPMYNSKYRFLNSGGYIGYASSIMKLLRTSDIEVSDDDQRFFVNLFLDDDVREENKLMLDWRCIIFQPLADAEMQLEFDAKSHPRLTNIEHKTHPIVIHGNGNSKIIFNNFANYLANRFDAKRNFVGHKQIGEKRNKLDPVLVLLAVHITQPTPFLEEFFDSILKYKYPKEDIILVGSNLVPEHATHMFKFLLFAKEHGYRDVRSVENHQGCERMARELTKQECLKSKCDFYFSLDAIVHLQPHALKGLVTENMTFISPVVTLPFDRYSNFWTSVDADGYHEKGFNYDDILTSRVTGTWNVPFVMLVYLIRSDLLSHATFPKFDMIPDNVWLESSFAEKMRSAGHFMYVINTNMPYGEMASRTDFDITNKHPELYTLSSNPVFWERRYLHPEFPKVLDLRMDNFPQPCPDVFWFPLVNDRFSDELVDIMNHYGKWSDGTNEDPRIGYENVPTRDIHLNQVKLEDMWKVFLNLYVRRVQQIVYPGYYSEADGNMFFVVRYKPDEQPSLEPHNDASKYTVNVALNEVGQDYEGGGCRFIRYKCEVVNTKKGWAMIHPGGLTHLHEGLETTAGIRYILVSFVNP